MVARVETRPSGEHSAISAASFMASLRTWSCGSNTLARPHRQASSPVTCRVVEIGAGAGRLALCGENGSPDFDIPVEFLQRVGDLVDQGDVEEIQRGPADLDQPDVTVLLDPDVRIFAHGLSSIEMS